jgi:regulator of replication initiation timing
MENNNLRERIDLRGFKKEEKKKETEHKPETKDSLYECNICLD